MALGAGSALQESGRRVPDDVALVGVDNWETVISGRRTRHLTALDTGLAALAAAAAQVADGRDAPGCTPTRARWWSARRRPGGSRAAEPPRGAGVPVVAGSAVLTRPKTGSERICG
ncbi:substrate-binding domain-containing protein [Streptomyces sp. NPDC048473]|uniref:substrate-binding domain-containing protein n=1 Tax=unclassified Streptomyces TaxID=2593676 RepID=UPI003712029C